MNKDNTSLSRLEDNLVWIVDYCGAISYYMNYFGRTVDDFTESMMYQDCCYSKINQIIQCVIRIQDHYPAIYQEYFETVMQGVRRMRVYFIHQYERALPEHIWNFMVQDLPLIEGAAITLLSKVQQGDHLVSYNTKPRFWRKS